jgi:hypothetical protein
MYDKILISSNEAIELAKTKAFGSLVTKISREFTQFNVYGYSGAISNILGTLKTAVFLTYGSSSFKATLSGSTKY